METEDSELDLIGIRQDLRLRAFDPDSASAPLMAELLIWYQDDETVTMVDGPGAERYDADKLLAMYRYLRDHGELYLVERRDPDRSWHTVGEVGLQRRAMPIVIAPTCRCQGLGRAVVATMLERARQLGWSSVHVSDIYDDNLASRRLFEGFGFRAVEPTEHGHRYVLEL